MVRGLSTHLPGSLVGEGKWATANRPVSCRGGAFVQGRRGLGESAFFVVAISVFQGNHLQAGIIS